MCVGIFIVMIVIKIYLYVFVNFGLIERFNIVNIFVYVLFIV